MNDYQPPPRALPETPWPNAIELAQPEPMDMHSDVLNSSAAAYERLMFLFKHALHQLGPGGLVVTSSDFEKPAPMFVKRDLGGGNVRYVTFQNGS